MDKKNISEIKNFLPEAEDGVLLSDFTSYKIGGPAEYFFIAKSKEDLVKALLVAKKLKIKVFILGGGSNVLVSDKGLRGLVIKINIPELNFFENGKVFAGAGANLTKTANLCTQKGFSGLEWAVGVPGTIGGSIYGHAQAFGDKISDIVESVEAINKKSLEVKNFSKEECKFSLKDSIFKRKKDFIIISAFLKFKIKPEMEIKNQIEENLKYRKARHPIGFPSAGSTFVNPEKKIKNKKLLTQFPEIIEYNKKGAIPAGFLISKCGLAGKKIGKAQISEMHANFIINLGGAKAKDVLALIRLAKQKVKTRFGIELKEEVQIIGF